jgi:hypothetical protein
VHHHAVSHVLTGPFGHHQLTMVRLTAYLAVLVFSGLMRSSLRITLPQALSEVEPTRARRRALVQRLRRLRRSQHGAERRDRPDSAGRHPSSEDGAALSLTAIELAMLAELNLEIARGHDEVADDGTRRGQTQQAAREVATALRERADAFRLEALRRSADPAYRPSMANAVSAYIGPDRRRQRRRTQARRRDGATGLGARGGGDRRTVPERRQRERRSGSLVLL